jgi:hypothetical protein
MDMNLREKMFGNSKFECGKLVKYMSVSEFENTFNVIVDEKTAQSNENGSTDYTATSKDLTIKIEVLDNNVTHINDYESDLLKVNGAWYLDSLPQHFVIELTNGLLKWATLSPFEDKSDALTEYKGNHPRKCKGQPLPAYLYRFYGLEKSDETASEVVHVRLTPTEKSKLEEMAGDKTVSEYIREMIREFGSYSAR